MPNYQILQRRFFLFFYIAILTSQSLLIISQAFPFNSDKQGRWQLLHESVGVSAMHMQLLHSNHVVIFDRTDFGPSNISLPAGRCRYDNSELVLPVDCTAHSILYHVDTNSYRPLMVQTDTWCSSGAVLPNGTLAQTGGYNDGDRTMRTFTPCDDESCDWTEFPNFLARRRWYATNQLLPDGRVFIIGGRREYNYEFLSPDMGRSPTNFWLGFLEETRDAGSDENNLYPFVHLLPDGNIFIFANKRSILFDYNNHRIVKELPEFPGADEAHNYPSSGSSVLLPLDENDVVEPQVMVCGGAPIGAYSRAKSGHFVRASDTCGRLNVSGDNPTWEIEEMPTPRVMGDMILLPSGDVLIINGAESGTAGWELARNPNTQPIIYYPPARQFWVMNPSPRPRMYHSTAILLPDGRILVGGSNPHTYYNFTGVDFPTDLSLEAFYPPYLSRSYIPLRPYVEPVDEILGYGIMFPVRFKVAKPAMDISKASVVIIAPAFTTHCFGMNQRMVVLKTVKVKSEGSRHEVTVVGPSTPEIAPPGYYLLFLVLNRVPSPGLWVKIG